VIFVHVYIAAPLNWAPLLEDLGVGISISPAQYRKVRGSHDIRAILESAWKSGMMAPSRLARLQKWASRCFPHVILVAPDVLHDAERTLRRTREWLSELRDEDGRVLKMVVPQGRNVKELIKCYERLPSADLVGVGRLACFDDEDVAATLIERVSEPVHLLGWTPHRRLPFKSCASMDFRFYYFKYGSQPWQAAAKTRLQSLLLKLENKLANKTLVG